MFIIVLQYTPETYEKKNLKILKQQSLRNTKFVSLPKLLAMTDRKKRQQVVWCVQYLSTLKVMYSVRG